MPRIRLRYGEKNWWGEKIIFLLELSRSRTAHIHAFVRKYLRRSGEGDEGREDGESESERERAIEREREREKEGNIVRHYLIAPL